MGDGDEDDLGVVEAVDEAERKSAEHVALVASVDAGQRCGAWTMPLKAVSTVAWNSSPRPPGVIVLVGRRGSSPRWRRGGLSAVSLLSRLADS